MSQQNTTQDEQLLNIVKSGNSGKGKMLRWVLLVVAIVAAIWGWMLWSASQNGNGVSYLTEEVKRGKLNVTVSATGNLQPTNQVDIGSELSGVFNWVLDGLQRLLKQKRFTQSAAVDAALQQYRTRSDSVRSYLEEHGLQPSVDAHKPLKDIYTAYTVHCKESGSHPCALRTFAERMRNTGYTITRSNGVRLVWAECEAEIKDVF